MIITIIVSTLFLLKTDYKHVMISDDCHNIEGLLLLTINVSSKKDIDYCQRKYHGNCPSLPCI